MLNFARSLLYNNRLETIYTERFKEFGSEPLGSFWLNADRQTSRFKIILNQVLALKPKGRLFIADIGCGYGALARYIKTKKYYRRINYVGYDINKYLVNQCEKSITENWARFCVGDRPNNTVEFSVMSGTYNLAPTKNVANWEMYVFNCLNSCWSRSSHGMVFNLLVAEKPFISDGRIYYSNAERIRRYCSAGFGPTRVIRESALPKDATFIVMRR